MIYLDTHVVDSLNAGELDLLSPGVHQLLEREDLAISPMVELECLYESGRTSRRGKAVIDALAAEVGLVRCGLPFARVMARALEQSWTRDPFDRIIVTEASARRLPLLTRDQSILDHYEDAIWVH